jgi:hypothetical protein
MLTVTLIPLTEETSALIMFADLNIISINTIYWKLLFFHFLVKSEKKP